MVVLILFPLEGAQLLALIDKGLDACRYMQTYGQWYMSVWLAKSTLNEREAKEVIMRWGEHLASSTVNQKVNFIYLFIYFTYLFLVFFLKEKGSSSLFITWSIC